MSYEKNVFLLLIRLDWTSPALLGVPTVTQERRPVMEEADDQRYSMLVGVLDPGEQATSTPLALIEFEPARRRVYNRIIAEVEDMLFDFESDDGYVDVPHRLNRRRQAELADKIAGLGETICGLLRSPGERTAKLFQDALERLLYTPKAAGQEAAQKAPQRESPERKSADWDDPMEQHVTIITNDFNIPWHWMRVAKAHPALCEQRPVGLLQLSGRAMREALQINAGSREAGQAFRALLVGDAQADLPFLADELKSVSVAIAGQEGRYKRRGGLTFAPDIVYGRDQIFGIMGRYPVGRVRRDTYRLFHYAGHWALSGEDTLHVSGDPIDISDVADFIQGSVLALDGCSTARGLNGWADLNSVTSLLLGHGALGCIVSTFPVRDDPLASEVFWGTFYKGLLSGSTTIGQALLRARLALAAELRSWDVTSITPLVYQLVGNPSVRLGSAPRVDA